MRITSTKHKRIVVLLGSLLVFIMAISVVFAKSHDVLAEELSFWEDGARTDEDLVLKDEYVLKHYYPEWYIGYRYPVLPRTSQWPYGNHQDMVDICQLPDGVLEQMSTEELLQTVLLYPLLGDINAYDESKFGFNMIKETFPGLKELCRRSDRMECLLQWIETHREWFLAKSEEEDEYLDYLFNLPKRNFMLLVNSEDFVRGGLPDGEDSLLDIINGILSNESERSVQESREIYPVSYLGFNDFTYVSSQNVNTPRGGTMQGITYDAKENWIFSDNNIYIVFLSDVSSDGIQADRNYWYSVYGLNPDKNSTVKYNCHSYAWYSTSDGNTFWINEFDTYNYTEVSLQSVNVGGIVVYCESYGGNINSGTTRKHSAIVQGKIYHQAHMNIVVDLYLKSKWGRAGLYSHQFANCPYYYYGNTNYVSDRIYYN